MATTVRTFRIPEGVWVAAVAQAQQEGTTVTAVVLDALMNYLATPTTPKRKASK